MKVYKILIVHLILFCFSFPYYAQEQFKPRVSSTGYSKSFEKSGVTIFSSVGLPVSGICSNPMIQIISGRGSEDVISLLSKIIDETADETCLPKEFKLYRNYPNPFNSSTRIKFEVSENKTVEIILFDVLGSEVQKLISEEKPAGVYEIYFNAVNLTSGIYFFRMTAGTYIKTEKMVLLK